jgi:hypothetical protein
MRRHLRDVARLALTKQAIAWQVLSRTVFGARVPDTTRRRAPDDVRLEPDATSRSTTTVAPGR